MTNYFADGMDAARYARSRPNIHATAIEKFRSFAEFDKPLSLALDVGCGTGQSTVALVGMAECVIGIDLSRDMLRWAAPHPNVEYCESAAEVTPFRDGQFDLVCVAQAFHWFDHAAFLPESYRLLRKRGWFLVYTSWFSGQMQGEPAFSDWFNGQYLSRYPTPARNRTPLTEERTTKHGFAFRGEDEFFNEIPMTIRRFTDFRLSTTNVIASVKGGKGSFDEAARWIDGSLEPFFVGAPQRSFLFNGKIWYVEKPAR